MTYTTAEKLNNVHAAARDAYFALIAASDALDGLLAMTTDVDVRDIAGTDASGVELESVLDGVDDIRTDIAILGGMRRRAARFAKMTKDHAIPAPK